MAKDYGECLEGPGGLPLVNNFGLNTNRNVDFSGASTIALSAGTTIGGSSLTALGTITSSSAQALAVGLNGLTNPAFNVDASTAVQAAGLNVKGAIAAGTVAVSVISSGAAANLTINAKGTGTIGIGTISTGAITLGSSTLNISGTTVNLPASATIASAGTGATGTLIADPVNLATSSLSGTALDVEILIGGVPYYFHVYPAKA